MDFDLVLAMNSANVDALQGRALSHNSLKTYEVRGRSLCAAFSTVHMTRKL